MKKYLFLTLVLISQSICVGKTLKFIGDINFKTGKKFKKSKIGGLSGLAFDITTNQLLAISDDRGNRGSKKRDQPRFYNLSLNFKKNFKVKFEKVTYLKMAEEDFKPFMIDPEGISIIDKNTIAISSEGFIPIISPAILIFNKDGVLKDKLEIPSKFEPKGVFPFQTGGIEYNAAFETLTITPDKQYLLVATEFPLKQDSFLFEDKKKNYTRIIQYKNKNGKYVYNKEFLYGIPIELGLVDIIAYTNKNGYSLERGYNSKTKKQTILIYDISWKNCSDVSSINSITKDTFKNPVTKELLLNLDDIIPQLEKKHRKLDNIEGITIGPKLPNGHDTLIVVSDNNFSKKQRTLFFAFEIIP